MPTIRAAAGALVAGALPLFSAPIAAEEAPAFRPGLWEFKRTIDPGVAGKSQELASTRCASPSEDMKRQREKLQQVGCTFSPVSRSGKVYTFTAQCPVHGVQGESKTALTVESDSAYSVRVEIKQGAQTATEVLKARRTGECAK
jgi:hypothetical protein